MLVHHHKMWHLSGDEGLSLIVWLQLESKREISILAQIITALCCQAHITKSSIVSAWKIKGIQEHCWRLKSCVCLPHKPLILLSKPLLKSASPIILHTSTVFLLRLIAFLFFSKHSCHCSLLSADFVLIPDSDWHWRNTGGWWKKEGKIQFSSCANTSRAWWIDLKSRCEKSTFYCFLKAVLSQ